MPGFMDMWNGTELVNFRLLGVPAEEYLWVMSIGVGLPIIMAVSLNARIDPAH